MTDIAGDRLAECGPNRWGLSQQCLVAIPPAATQVGEVSEGELFRVETIDWTGGQIADNDCADDIKHVDLTQV